MNILIKGMEKPKSCYNHCLEGFIANKEIGCPLKDYIESHQYKDRIHPDCPLIEIIPCKECKHSKVYTLQSDAPMKRWCHKGHFPKEVTDGYYCGDGERRADEHNTEGH